VVHVPVGEQDVVNRNHLVRRFADIEADVQLRHGDHGLLTRDGVADDIQVFDLYMG